MTLKEYRGLIGVMFVCLIGVSCKNETKHSAPYFSYNSLGYYYQLIAFDDDSKAVLPNRIAWLSATFRTQADSIFWDSFNNMNDKFYVQRDTLLSENFLANYVSVLQEFDSVCLLLKPKDFFQQQFKYDSIPFFSKKDSIVKINLKVKRLFTKEEFLAVQQNLLANEMAQIYKFFTTEAEANAAKDQSGFYWVSKEGQGSGMEVKLGQTVTITYEGYFLNGRFLEKSGKKFELKYGTPDQVLKGLNYVIAGLKLGQSAKIILPSPLAFGENGSSNGIVPPFTPLIYQVNIIDIKE